MAKISTFIVGMVLISLFVTVLGTFMADMAHNSDITYDNSSIAKYQVYDDLYNTTKDLENKTGEISASTGVIDLIGDFFSSGYTVLLTSKKSMETFNVITIEAAAEANLGETAPIIAKHLMLIVLITIVIGVFLAAVMKWYI